MRDKFWWLLRALCDDHGATQVMHCSVDVYGMMFSKIRSTGIVDAQHFSDDNAAQVIPQNPSVHRLRLASTFWPAFTIAA